MNSLPPEPFRYDWPCKPGKYLVDADAYDALRRIRGSAAHDELRTIHAILMSVADCPPIQEGDSLTVRYVKNLCHAYNSAIVEGERRTGKASKSLWDRTERRKPQSMSADCVDGFCHVAEARGEHYRCQGKCAYAD